MSVFLEQLKMYSQAARNAESDGSMMFAARHYSAALLSCLEHLVSSYSSYKDACSALETLKVSALFESFMINLKKSREGVDGCKNSPFSAYVLTAIAHFAMLTGKAEYSEELVEVAMERQIQQRATQLMRLYTQSFLNAIHKQCFEPPEFKPKGYEKYFLPYLKLFHAIVEGDQLQKVITEVDAAFEKRNKDKRTNDDDYGIDGTGKKPVCWDFRKESIIRVKELW